ncbi:class I SAM-dependent methyltransferase, partial [Gammaproteobacteria bacterium]|nr:class I SAM-dependent methyltransferase [Gammaproteobacteria bacterium]
RVAWDEAAAKHAAHNNRALFAAAGDPDFVSFEGEILNSLQQVGVEAKQVIQLGCNNGRETLSLRNMGAARCVGVDASAEFLAHGREMIRIAGVEDQVELVEADIYALPQEFQGEFDLVVVTIGVISWLPDLKAFFEVVRDLLKPGGQLVMEEMHPVLFMYEEDPDGGPSVPQYSYFSGEVWEETSGLDYYAHETYDSLPNYSFMHRLDEILMAAIACDLQLSRFVELDCDISNFCSDLEHSPLKPPLGFVMVMIAQ